MRFNSGWLLAGALLLSGCEGQMPLLRADSGPKPENAPTAKAAPAPVRRATEAQAIAAVSDENSIFFASNESEIDADGKAKLQRHAQRLKGDDRQVVRLIGHTDDQGSRGYNIAISEQRVEAVFKALRALGVPAVQLRRSSMGSEKVADACRSPACRNKMRRVEIVYEP